MKFRAKALAVSLFFIFLGCATAPHKTASAPVGSITSTSNETAALYSARAYDRLLTEYRRLAERGGWPGVPPGAKLQTGDQGERVLALRRRLKTTGELKGDFKNALFDEKLVTAVKDFQERHGLEPDGAVGQSTLAALNISVEDRHHQIELNQRRFEEKYSNFENEYLAVNIPEFQLHLIEDGKTVFSSKVIVGQKKEWMTPLLTSRITYLIINPKWNVPPEIFEKEMINDLRTDPAYIVKNRMKILRNTDGHNEVLDPEKVNWADVDPKESGIRIVQDEGAGNSLGRLKFLFPNPYNVYLHDTPQKKLFANAMRALSHGCVRVEKPLELAEYLVGPQGLTREAIEQWIQTGKTRDIALKTSVPIHIIYLTAWRDEEGRAQFRNDIYSQDP